MYRPPRLRLTPSAAYASPTAKPAAINAVVPRRAFFICLSLVLVQADASIGPPSSLRPLERPKIRNSPKSDDSRLSADLRTQILRGTGIGSRRSRRAASFFHRLWQKCHTQIRPPSLR